jgi:hypothetical protein
MEAESSAISTLLDRVSLGDEGILVVDITDRVVDAARFSDVESLRTLLSNAPRGEAEVLLFQSAMWGVGTEVQLAIISFVPEKRVVTSDGYDYLSFLASIYFDAYEQSDAIYPDAALEGFHLPLFRNAIDAGFRFHEAGELDRQLARAKNFGHLEALLRPLVQPGMPVIPEPDLSSNPP